MESSQTNPNVTTPPLSREEQIAALPAHMRSHDDPRTLAEHIDPATAPRLNKKGVYGAWLHIEAALYRPDDADMLLDTASDLLAEAEQNATDHVTPFKIRFIQADLPLYRQRATGLETITGDDLFTTYVQTVPIIEDLHAEIKANRGKLEALESLGPLSESIIANLIRRAANDRYKAFSSSFREDIGQRIPVANHDVGIIVDDRIKLPIQVKLSEPDEPPFKDANQHKREVAGVMTVGFSSFLQKHIGHYNPDPSDYTRRNDRANIKLVVDLMKLEAEGQIDPSDTEILAPLNDLTRALLGRIDSFLPKISDENGYRRPWEPIPEIAESLEPEVVALFQNYVLSKTVDSPTRIGAARHPQILRLSEHLRASYDQVEISSVTGSAGQPLSEETLAVAKAFGVEIIDLVFEPVLAAQSIRLLREGQVTLEAVCQDTGSDVELTLAARATANLIKRLLAADANNVIDWESAQSAPNQPDPNPSE